MSSKDAKRSVDGKAMELHEVEAGALKATDPLTLPTLLKKLIKPTPATADKRTAPRKGTAMPTGLTLAPNTCDNLTRTNA